MTPDSSAGPPASALTMWAVRSMTTSSPGFVWTFTAISLAIVADGRYHACSLPRRAATRSCSALAVGSSNFCSSPTGARIMNWRIASDGRVAVSLDRSIIVAKRLPPHFCAVSKDARIRAEHRGTSPATRSWLPLAPERLGQQVAGDAELTRHQGRPGQEPFDHHQGFVFDFVRVQRLVHVAQMIADTAAEPPHIAQQFDGHMAGLLPDHFRTAGGRAQPRRLRAGPIDEVVEDVDGFAGTAFHDHRDEPLAGAPDLADEARQKPLFVGGEAGLPDHCILSSERRLARTSVRCASEVSMRVSPCVSTTQNRPPVIRRGS